MDKLHLKRYANLLVKYCLNIQTGDRLLVQSTTLAEPLIAQIYRACLQAGGHCEVQMSMNGQAETLLELGSDEQLSYTPTVYKKAMEEFEAYLVIKAPFDQRRKAVNPERATIRQKAMHPLWQTYSRRTATGEMKRSLCLYPCQSLADSAGMDLEDYTQFVIKACKLDGVRPIEDWQTLGQHQQHIVDYLNNKDRFRYVNDRMDVSFSTTGRTWINSDGKTNMPSGEVYTSPVEESVEGEAYFDYPAIREGQEVRGIWLKISKGEIVDWSAEAGSEVLERALQVPGARRFGEAAIGTNYLIDQFTKNILFDEKIGGTVHMAIGQSYLQAGGKNESSVHWDMIADMTKSGRIYANDGLIYENGHFLPHILGQ
ncbi:MAG: aminopeptidase [Bacteroidota bacterium]